MRLPVALLAFAGVLAGCAQQASPALPPGMPLPASLRILSVRHPALAVARVTGERAESPPVMERSYALTLARAGWTAELHPGRVVGRNGKLQIDARFYARGKSTLFAAEELRDQFYIAPRRQAKVNAEFFETRMRRVKAVESAAWQLESGKRLYQAAPGLERAIALAADTQRVARRLHAERYAELQTPVILDARLRLGFVLSKQKRRSQAFEEWRKVLHGQAVVPAADAHPSPGSAWKLLQASLEDRAPGTRPTPHELGLVKVLLTQPAPAAAQPVPVTRYARPKMQLHELPVPQIRATPAARPVRRHRRFLFWQWTTKP